MITEWNDKELLKRANEAAFEANKKGARKVRIDAIRILMNDAKHPTGKLASEIEIKESKYKDGGFIVQAQGPGNYDKFYATFVELGTYKMEKVPYLRPALAKNRRNIMNSYKGAMK